MIIRDCLEDMEMSKADYVILMIHNNIIIGQSFMQPSSCSEYTTCFLCLDFVFVIRERMTNICVCTDCLLIFCHICGKLRNFLLWYFRFSKIYGSNMRSLPVSFTNCLHFVSYVLSYSVFSSNHLRVSLRHCVLMLL